MMAVSIVGLYEGCKDVIARLIYRFFRELSCKMDSVLGPFKARNLSEDPSRLIKSVFHILVDCVMADRRVSVARELTWHCLLLVKRVEKKAPQ